MPLKLQRRVFQPPKKEEASLPTKTYAQVVKNVLNTTYPSAAQPLAEHASAVLQRKGYETPTNPALLSMSSPSALMSVKNLRNSGDGFSPDDEKKYIYEYVPKLNSTKETSFSQQVTARPVPHQRARKKHKSKRRARLQHLCSRKTKDAKRKQNIDDYEAMKEAKRLNGASSQEDTTSTSSTLCTCSFFLLQIVASNQQPQIQMVTEAKFSAELVYHNTLKDRKKFNCFLGIKELLHSTTSVTVENLGLNSGKMLKLKRRCRNGLPGGGTPCSKFAKLSLTRAELYRSEFMTPQKVHESQLDLNNHN